MAESYESAKAALLVRFSVQVAVLGSASTLFVETAPSQHCSALRERAASRFAPSTLNRYLNAWDSWSMFCAAMESAPHCPRAGLLPDWLYSMQSKQGLATNQLRALSWMCKVAGLPTLRACLDGGLPRAFATASAPLEKREALPFSVSFIAWLERIVCSDTASPSEVFQMGVLLVLVWGSLRWNDALWSAPTRLVLRQEDMCITAVSTRTKTTNTGMPWGCSVLGLTGTTSCCWGLRFWTVFQAIQANTQAACPGVVVDYLPSVLSSDPALPCVCGPLLRPQAIPWLRALLARHWREHCADPLPEVFAFVGVHSAKATVLSWARQLHLDPELRRIQGHHRGSGSDLSLRLYSRDDIAPMILLQRQIIDRIRSSFRPLQALHRGASAPLLDFPLSLPPAQPGPAEAIAVPDQQPEEEYDAQPLDDSELLPEDFDPPAPESPADSPLSDPVSEGSGSSSDGDALPPDRPALSSAQGRAVYLLHPRSRVLHLAMPCSLNDPRGVIITFGDGSEAVFKPACGAESALLDSASLYTAPPDRCSLCLRRACAAAFQV